MKDRESEGVRGGRMIRCVLPQTLIPITEKQEEASFRVYLPDLILTSAAGGGGGLHVWPRGPVGGKGGVTTEGGSLGFGTTVT